MADFIRIGVHTINIAHVIRVERRDARQSAEVWLAEADFTELDGQPASVSLCLEFRGEEAAAVLWHFEHDAVDVLAMHAAHSTTQAQHAATMAAVLNVPMFTCPSCHGEPVAIEGRWCERCMADFEARR